MHPLHQCAPSTLAKQLPFPQTADEQLQIVDLDILDFGGCSRRPSAPHSQDSKGTCCPEWGAGRANWPEGLSRIGLSEALWRRGGGYGQQSVGGGRPRWGSCTAQEGDEAVAGKRGNRGGDGHGRNHYTSLHTWWRRQRRLPCRELQGSQKAVL